LTIISHAENVKELEQLTKFAKACGKDTGKFLELAGDKALDIYKLHGSSKLMVQEMSTSLRYGDQGANLLLKVGPDKFRQLIRARAPGHMKLRSILHLIGISKYTLAVRGIKSLLTGSMMALLIWIAKALPLWAIFAIAGVSGLVVIGIPSVGFYRAWHGFRTPA
jgi:hypothetical protein